MNKIVLSVISAAAILGTASQAQADLLAAWDFAGLTNTSLATVTVPTIGASIGVATLDVSAFGLGTPQGTNPERTAFAGTTLNLFTGGDINAVMALALANMSANGKSAVFSFNMTGSQDLVVTFATRGTSTGFDTGLWSWSTDGVNYTTVAGLNTATRSTTWAVATADFSSISALDNAPTAFLKYTLSGATSASGNNRMDNIQFNVVAVPEPGVSVLLGLGMAGMFIARRRS